MKNQIALTIFLASFSVLAETQAWSYIKTSRGTDLGIKITKSLKANSPLLVVAPGQSCNSKGPLFETIEQEAINKEINVIRFEWSYCSPTSTNRNPSDDLSTEISDMDFAINYGKILLQKTNNDLIISGKSLGSMVAYRIFKNHSNLKSLILLTPVCSYLTDELGNPLPTPLDVINESYSDLRLETRPLLMISGSSDPLCDHTILKLFKEKAHANLEVIFVKGDHGFRILNADGSANKDDSQNNLLNVARGMFNWFSAI